MSYTINPDVISSSIYPIMFRNEDSTATVQQKVMVYVDGSLAGTFKASKTSSNSSASIFDTNVQSFVQSELAPFVGSKTTVFPSLGTFTITENTDVIKSLYCSAYAETINSSGFLVTSTAPQLSTTGYVIPANFYGYIYNLGTFYQPSANPFQFLTGLNDAREINENSNLYLSFLGKGVNSAEVEFFTKSGSSSVTVVDMANSTANNSLYTISFGAKNIFGTTAVFHVGNFPTSSTAYNYYKVSVGRYDGAFTRLSEQIRININPDCSDNVEVHWFGVHGGAESFVFKGLIEEETKVEGDIINLSQKWNVAGGSAKANSYDKQLIRNDTRVNKSIVVSASVTPEQADYISTLISSPEVYVILDNKYVSVVVENQTINTANNRTPFINISLKLTFANKPISQL